MELVQKNNSLARTHELAKKYSEQAIITLRSIPESRAKEGLIHLANLVITRKY